MRTALCVAAGAIAAGALARPVAAQSRSSVGQDPAPLVARAQREMDELDFESAIRFLERAEDTGGNQRDDLIVIYRSLGECQAGLGRGEDAELEFRRLLALDPDAQLSPGSSPKLTEPFKDAQDYIRRRGPLSVACERRPDGAILDVLVDPNQQVAGGRLLHEDGSPLADSQTTAGKDDVSLAIPPGSPRALACSVLDSHGNELARAPLLSAATRRSRGDRPDGSGQTATDLLPPGEAMSETIPGGAGADGPSGGSSDEPEGGDESPPLLARWWLWGTGSVVAAGVGAYFGVKVQDDEDAARDIKKNPGGYYYQDALDVKDRGERHALYSRIAFGTAAALATVSVVLLIRRAGRSDSERSARIGAAPVDGGVAASLWFAF